VSLPDLHQICNYFAVIVLKPTHCSRKLRACWGFRLKNGDKSCPVSLSTLQDVDLDVTPYRDASCFQTSVICKIETIVPCVAQSNDLVDNAILVQFEWRSSAQRYA